MEIPARISVALFFIRTPVRNVPFRARVISAAIHTSGGIQDDPIHENLDLDPAIFQGLESPAEFKIVANFSPLAAEATCKLLQSPPPGTLRTAFVYFPNGCRYGLWWPECNDFGIQRTLQPLEDSRAQIQILGGLDHLNATAGMDGGGDHARANEHS